MKHIKYTFILVLTVFFFACSNPFDKKTGNDENIDFDFGRDAIFLIPETGNIESVAARDVGICPSLYDNVYLIIQIRVLKGKKPTEFYVTDENNNLKNNNFEETDLSRFNNINNKSFNIFKDNPYPNNNYYKYYIKKLSNFSLVNTILDESYNLKIIYKDRDNKRGEMPPLNLKIKYFPTETTWNDLITAHVSEQFFPKYKSGNHVILNDNLYSDDDMHNDKDGLRTLHRNNLDDYVFKPGKKE